MKHPIIDKILIEWSYRVHDGMPNPKNPVHLVHLRESLEHLKIDEEVIDIMMNKLYERDIAKNEKLVPNPNPSPNAKKKMVTLAYAKTFYKDKGVNVDDMSDEEIAKMADTDSEKGTTDDKELTDEPKVGQTTELPKPKKEEKNKELNQDIDYSGGENTPEHITAENGISDEEFEQKKKDGKVKEQTYKNKYRNTNR